MDVVADMPPGEGDCASWLASYPAESMPDLPGELLYECAEEGLPGSIEELHRRAPAFAADLIRSIRDHPKLHPDGLADQLTARLANL